MIWFGLEVIGNQNTDLVQSLKIGKINTALPAENIILYQKYALNIILDSIGGITLVVNNAGVNSLPD